MPLIGEKVTGNKEAYTYLVESIRKFPTQAELTQMFSQVGFSRVKCRNLSNGIVSNPAAIEVSKKMHSIGKIGSPETIAKFATPLILDSSSWITGSIINIDGGLSTTKLVS